MASRVITSTLPHVRDWGTLNAHLIPVLPSQISSFLSLPSHQQTASCLWTPVSRCLCFPVQLSASSLRCLICSNELKVLVDSFIRFFLFFFSLLYRGRGLLCGGFVKSCDQHDGSDLELVQESDERFHVWRQKTNRISSTVSWGRFVGLI